MSERDYSFDKTGEFFKKKLHPRWPDFGLTIGANGEHTVNELLDCCC